MTLKELTEGLADILTKHPELADKHVYHAAECGYSGAGFESPLTIAVPIPKQDSGITEPSIKIVSDDDGFDNYDWYSGWKFITSEDEKLYLLKKGEKK